MHLFGKKRKNRITSEETLKAIQSLQNVIEYIDRHSNLLQRNVKNEFQKALQHKGLGDIEGALVCLKRKKMYENEITTLERLKLNLEQQLICTESATSSKFIFDALRTGNSFVSLYERFLGGFKFAEIDKFKDDMENRLKMAVEHIDNINQLRFISIVDDHELIDELKDMEYEDFFLDGDVPIKADQPHLTVSQYAENNELEDLFNEMQMIT